MNDVKRFRFSGIVEIAVVVILAFFIRTFGYGLYRVPTGSMETTMLVGELFFADKCTPLFSTLTRGEIIAFNTPEYTYSSNIFIALFQRYVWGPSNWTKRIIGVPGDTVRGTIEHSKPVIYINGEKVNEPYVNKYPLLGVWKDISENKKGEQGYDSWALRSYDPTKSLDKQVWYQISDQQVIRRIDGSQIVRLPDTPITQPRRWLRNSSGNYWDGSDEFHVTLKDDEYWVMGDNRLNSHDSRAFGPLPARYIHGIIRYRLASVDCDASWIVLELLKSPIAFFDKFRWNRCLQKVS